MGAAWAAASPRASTVRTITHSQGESSVYSIDCFEHLIISGGTLTAGKVQVHLMTLRETGTWRATPQFSNGSLYGTGTVVFDGGRLERDFTYVDDIIESIKRLIPKAPNTGTVSQATNNESPTKAPYQLFNIGHGSPVSLMNFIHEIEKNLGVEAQKKMMPIQPGDVPKTWADVEGLFNVVDFRPKVSVEEGIKKFIEWYREYYRI